MSVARMAGEAGKIIGQFLADYRVIPKDEDSSYEFIKFLKKAKSKIDLVTGELDPSFYERPEVVDIVRKFLQNSGKVRVVYHGDKSEYSRARERFESKNGAWLKFKKDFPDRISIYWTPLRPSAHYAISDDRHLFFEGLHEPYKDRECGFFYNEPELGQEWTANFESYISHSKVRELE